jgi:zinc transporter ZupT
MKLWIKLWLLFTVIWVIVAGLNVATILAFGDEVDPHKALWPAFFGVLVPALVYAVGWVWERLTKN